MPAARIRESTLCAALQPYHTACRYNTHLREDSTRMRAGSTRKHVQNLNFIKRDFFIHIRNISLLHKTVA
jgi:hypothetical protein